VGLLKVVRFAAAAAAAAAVRVRAGQEVWAVRVGQVAGLLGHPSALVFSLPRIRTGLLESTSWAAAGAEVAVAPLSMELREIMEVMGGSQAVQAGAAVQARAVAMVVMVVVVQTVSFIYG